MARPGVADSKVAAALDSARAEKKLSARDLFEVVGSNLQLRLRSDERVAVDSVEESVVNFNLLGKSKLNERARSEGASSSRRRNESSAAVDLDSELVVNDDQVLLVDLSRVGPMKELGPGQDLCLRVRGSNRLGRLSVTGLVS